MKGNNACQKEQHSEWEIAVFCIVALGVLLTFNILIFRNSRDSLLKLQEDNMLATAKRWQTACRIFMTGRWKS